MKEYIRKVAYHETDKMGITHHSNYIKWMEEARVHYLEQIGCGYAKMEANGIVSPVIGVECQYKNSTTFDDTVAVYVEIEEYKGVRLILSYKILNAENGQTVLTGKSMHCFVDSNGKPIMLKKKFPNVDEKLRKHARADAEEK